MPDFTRKADRAIALLSAFSFPFTKTGETLLEQLSDYYVILAEVDGHSPHLGDLVSVEKNCAEIETYINDHLSGHLYCLSGFSMGATMAVEIIGRGNVHVEKTHLNAVMEKDNNSIIEMLYPDITQETIKYACAFVYAYHIPEKIRDYKGTVLFWRGSNERYPRKSAALLKRYLPGLTDVEIENMGHGQYLHEHSEQYAEELIKYLEN